MELEEIRKKPTVMSYYELIRYYALEIIKVYSLKKGEEE